MDAGPKKPRFLFLDNIKLLFAILVTFQHARVTYGGSGDWYYIESNSMDPFSSFFFFLVTSIGGLFQASLLGLFFLMGGYFTPKSYDRKGFYSFWKERLPRLGIPILLYIFIINPLLVWILSLLGILPWNNSASPQTSLLYVYLNSFQSLSRALSFLTDFGPMWFLFVLLIFTAGYSIWRQLTKNSLIKQRIPKEFSIPKYIYLLLLAFGLGCVTFLIRIEFPIDESPFGIPLAFIMPYLMMFSVGIIAFRYNWFQKMTRHHVYIWFITILITIILFFLYIAIVLGFNLDLNVLTGGINLSAFLFALVENIICMGMIFVLIKMFYAKFNRQGIVLKNMSSSAFHIYLIHPIVLVAISIGFAPIHLIPVIKLAIVFPLTVFVCYLISHYFLQKIHIKKRSDVLNKSIF